MVCYDGRLYMKYRVLIGRARMMVIFYKLTKSSFLDEVNINDMDRHDKIFQPINQYEKAFWEKSRALTKKQARTLLLKQRGGKLGGRPKKELQTDK